MQDGEQLSLDTGEPTASAATEAMAKLIAAFASLTDQQARVARLFARGLSALEVGAELDISPKTVYSHRHEIFRKIGVRNTVELAREAIRAGFAPL